MCVPLLNYLTVSLPDMQVSHVVLFDFPLTLQDYLHRVGRTGRVGSVANNCRATSFMSHRRDVRMAWKIKVMNILSQDHDAMVLYVRVNLDVHRFKSVSYHFV